MSYFFDKKSKLIKKIFKSSCKNIIKLLKNNKKRNFV